MSRHESDTKPLKICIKYFALLKYKIPKDQNQPNSHQPRKRLRGHFPENEKQRRISNKGILQISLAHFHQTASKPNADAAPQGVTPFRKASVAPAQHERTLSVT
jgi:hypothetical protein